MNWATFWIALGALGTCASAVVILFSILFLARQVREADRGIRLSAYLSLQEWLQAEDYRRARRALHQLSDGTREPQSLTEEEVQVVEQACVPFQMVGHMIQLELLPPELVEDWRESAQKLWSAASEYVEWRRVDQSTPDLWRAFQAFAEDEPPG